MARNDLILLDGILDERGKQKQPSSKRDEALEYLAAELLLREFDLSSDEILAGLTDSRRDGGIDGFYIIVNGHLLQDLEGFPWPKIGSEVTVFVITSKHHSTFKQSVLDKLIATLTQLLDLRISDAALESQYSAQVRRTRHLLKEALHRLASRLSSFSINVRYVSRGDTSDIGEEVKERGSQINALVQSSFSNCTSSVSFVGAAELVTLYRKVPNYTLELPFVSQMSSGERYVLLTRLSDYFRFISDEGKLRRHLFESNVRDYMGINRVNEDILMTLNDLTSPDFWWLNNGVTILARSATITGNAIQAREVQIVNGLQTTESIYRHFAATGPTEDNRCILVKVIVTEDDVVRDAIIRATNNQTAVEYVSLHATDPIQRSIDEICRHNGLYYERQKNYYVNLGHEPCDIVSPTYLAAGSLALILKQPHLAAAFRPKMLRHEKAYSLIFSDEYPLGVWPAMAKLLKKLDGYLEELRPREDPTGRFLKGWRYLLSLVLVAQHEGSFAYAPARLAEFDVSAVSLDEVRCLWDELLNLGGRVGAPVARGWTQVTKVIEACTELAKSRSIRNVEVIARIPPPLLEHAYTRPKRIFVGAEMLESIRQALPPQPWPKNTHRAVAKQLGTSPRLVHAAIMELIERKELFRQFEGVVYDHDGKVLRL